MKDKLDFKLVNTAVLVLIIYLLYQTGNLWTGVIGKFAQILLPFLFAFAVAYAIHPFLQYLQEKKIPKSVAVLIIIALIVGIIAIMVVLIAPMLFEQLASLFNGIIAFLKQISMDYDLNIGSIQDSLSKTFNEIIVNLGKLVSDGAINVIGVSLGYISTFVIALSAAIYFLIDMDKIREKTKTYLKKKKTKTYRYIKRLDTEMKNYLTGFMKIVVITFFEYTLAFFIIGHPNALLLGCLAAVASLIPYFGGMITNIIAAITAFVISPALFFKTIIAFFILSALDGYLINPLVYGKTNQVHPLIVIISVFAGSTLFGVIGIIISLPVAILILATYKFYKTDIYEMIDEVKEKNKLQNKIENN